MTFYEQALEHRGEQKKKTSGRTGLRESSHLLGPVRVLGREKMKKEHKQTTNNMTLSTWQVVRASNCRSETHSTALHHRYLQEGKGSKDREDKAQTRVTRKHKCMRSEREERRGERCLMHYGRSLSRLKQNIYRMDQDCIC